MDIIYEIQLSMHIIDTYVVDEWVILIYEPKWNMKMEYVGDMYELKWYKGKIQWEVHQLQKKGGAIHGMCLK